MASLRVALVRALHTLADRIDPAVAFERRRLGPQRPASTDDGYTGCTVNGLPLRRDTSSSWYLTQAAIDRADGLHRSEVQATPDEPEMHELEEAFALPAHQRRALRAYHHRAHGSFRPRFTGGFVSFRDSTHQEHQVAADSLVVPEMDWADRRKKALGELDDANRAVMQVRRVEQERRLASIKRAGQDIRVEKSRDGLGVKAHAVEVLRRINAATSDGAAEA